MRKIVMHKPRARKREMFALPQFKHVKCKSMEMAIFPFLA